VLYLDSSALIKHYQKEPGTEALEGRLQMEAESSRSVFTSALTYAEIHATLARRTREKLLSLDEAALVHDRFDTDWV
jgi:predicted nucleic acid-binding protein